ncbi:MAG: FG-GAP-like repeat-containing protein, partial [Planctomycetaceae bacterium]
MRLADWLEVLRLRNRLKNRRRARTPRWGQLDLLEDRTLLAATSVVSLSISPSTVDENGGEAIVTATLNEISSDEVTVYLSFSGTATDGDDYTASGTSIVIAAGSLSNSISLVAVDDDLIEPQETIGVSIEDVSSGFASTQNRVTASIVDDEARPTVTLELLDDPFFSENGGVQIVRAVLSEVSTETVVVRLAFSGTATQGIGGDYIPSSSVIVIEAGNISGEMTLTGLNNAFQEHPETVQVDVTSIAQGVEANGVQNVLAIVVDDDPIAAGTLAVSDVSIVEGSAGPTFDIPETPAYYTTGARANGIASGDVNGDGHLDLVVANRIGDSVTVRFNDGTGEFPLSATYSVGNEATSVTLADLDGDGDLDIAATIENNVAVLRNNGSGLFGSLRLTAAGSLPSSVVAGDFNRDGKVDLAVGNAASGLRTVSILINNGIVNGGVSFLPRTTVTAGLQPTGLTVADLDNDNDIDIVVANGGGGDNRVSVLRNNGFGAFSVTSFAAGQVPVAVAVGDVNGDGQLDLAVANANSAPNGNDEFRNVTILLGTGNASFGAATSYEAADKLKAIALGDLDNDGDLDVIAVSEDAQDNLVAILRNSGTGSFAAPELREFPVGRRPNGVVAADFDGDGDIDFATSNQYGVGGADGISVFENGSTPRTVEFLVSLSAPSTSTVTVRYTTSPGSAVSGQDYATRSGILTFTPGQTIKRVTVPIIGDTVFEPTEGFSLVLSQPTNAAISDDTGVATIIDDDGAIPTVVLSLGGNPFTEGGGPATVFASLSAPAAVNDVIVELAFAGTADVGSDYAVSRQYIVIPVGSSTGTLQLFGLRDDIAEPDESVIVDVLRVRGATELGTQRVTAQLRDEDPNGSPDITLDVIHPEISEEFGDSAIVRAKLSRAATSDIRITLDFGGTASTGDFTVNPAEILIPAGKLGGQVTITAVDDTDAEDPETLLVRAAGVTLLSAPEVEFPLPEDEVEIHIADNDHAPVLVTLSV